MQHRFFQQDRKLEFLAYLCKYKCKLVGLCDGKKSTLEKRITMRIMPFRLFVIVILSFGLAGCQTELYSNLNEREANDMLSVLANGGIPAKKNFTKKQNFVLYVDESDMSDAIQLLNRLGYPRDTYTDMGQVFQKDGLISSPLEERARYVYAVSQDLSDTLSRVDGVIDAKVHVVLPETDVTGNIIKPPSASVFIKHQSQYNLQPFLPKIKLLVNKSIEGIDYQDISIALFPSEISSMNDRTAWSNVIGIKVHPSSKGRLVMILGLFLALIIASLAGNIALSRRDSRPGNSRRPLGSQPRQDQNAEPKKPATASA